LGAGFIFGNINAQTWSQKWGPRVVTAPTIEPKDDDHAIAVVSEK
jgi:hypothetical protein